MNIMVKLWENPGVFYAEQMGKWWRNGDETWLNDISWGTDGEMMEMKRYFMRKRWENIMKHHVPRVVDVEHTIFRHRRLSLQVNAILWLRQGQEWLGCCVGHGTLPFISSTVIRILVVSMYLSWWFRDAGASTLTFCCASLSRRFVRSKLAWCACSGVPN